MKRISSQRDFTIAIIVFTFYLPRKGIFNIFNFKKNYHYKSSKWIIDDSRENKTFNPLPHHLTRGKDTR